MRAVTIEPRRPGSLRLDDIAEPEAGGQVLVQALAVGICGTDRELLDGAYGEAPAEGGRLVLGHESLGRVLSAPEGSGYAPGDHVVGIVRHPDPLPCPQCAAGEWDMCENGGYTERGIKARQGFAAERWSAAADFLVPVSRALGLAGVLLEPASVLAKAWAHIEHIGRRARWTPRKVLVTGAGPVGLMAALMGRQRGLAVHVVDHNESGPKPDLVRALGCSYSIEVPAGGYDVSIECTGVPEVIARVLESETPNAIACLAGLSPTSGGAALPIAPFNQSAVLRNRVVFGSVNANRGHYRAAADALARADRGWLDGLITRVVPLGDFASAYQPVKGDVKTVLAFAN
ncbi:MAG: glucose 1-dehydrogenase [Clostridia bacterium]